MALSTKSKILLDKRIHAGRPGLADRLACAQTNPLHVKKAFTTAFSTGGTFTNTDDVHLQYLRHFLQSFIIVRPEGEAPYDQGTNRMAKLMRDIICGHDQEPLLPDLPQLKEERMYLMRGKVSTRVTGDGRFVRI